MTLTGRVQEFDQLAAHALGWASILNVLQTWLDDCDDEIKIAQVKEKFGTLRCYVNWAPIPEDASPETADALQQRWNVIYTVIDFAERLTAQVCYLCGAPQTHQGTGGWMRFFCAEHDTVDLMNALRTREVGGM